MSARRPRRVLLDIPADLRHLQLVGACVQAVIGGDGPDHVRRHEIEIAIHEICVNIVVHGHADREPGQIAIEITNDERELVAQITDAGAPFDAATVAPPDLGSDQVHGYGMFMAHELMDEVTYTRAGDRNHWRLTKRWS